MYKSPTYQLITLKMAIDEISAPTPYPMNQQQSENNVIITQIVGHNIVTSVLLLARLHV